MLTGKQLDDALALNPLGRCDASRKPCDQFRGAGCADWCVCGWHKSMHPDDGKSVITDRRP